MNVIMGNLCTFTVFQDHIFWSRSCQGQINIAIVYTVMYHRYAKYESDKHNGY